MQNVDSTEVHKFSERSDHWWDLKGPFRALHETNAARADFICQHLSTYARPKVLDVGCGGGILSEALALQNMQITGIDASSKAIHCAKQHAQQNQCVIDYQVSTAEDFLDKHTESFDAVTCLELLEHVPDPKSLVATCAKLIKPGGQVFFGTLNRTLKAYLLAIIGAEYVLRLLPIKTHDFRKFIKPSELQAYAQAAQLKQTDLKGIAYNPFFGTPKLTQDVSINYLMCTQRL